MNNSEARPVGNESQLRAAREQWQERWVAENARLVEREATLIEREEDLRIHEAEFEFKRRKFASEQRAHSEEFADTRARIDHDQALLDRKWQALELRESVLIKSSQEAAAHAQQQDEEFARKSQELDGLESRIQRHREKLLELQDRIGQPATTLRIETVPSSVESGAGNSPHGDESSDEEAPDFRHELLELVTLLVNDIEDEQARLGELYVRLHEIRSTWQAEWLNSLAILNQREDEVVSKKMELAAREHELLDTRCLLKHRWAELEQADEDFHRRRILAEQASIQFESERRQLLRHAEVCRETAREQLEMALAAQLEAEEQHGQRVNNLLRLQDKLEAARREYRHQSALLAQQERQNDAYERQLGQRDFVLKQIERELLARDGRPVEAADELKRRYDRLQKIGDKPLRRLLHREQELADDEMKLSESEGDIARREHQLVVQKQAIEQAQSELIQDKLLFERDRMDHEAEAEIAAHERAVLFQQVQDLEQQIERLALLLGNIDQPARPLALAA